MGDRFITGMWACDLQNSSDLEDEQKLEYTGIIKEKNEFLLKKYKIDVLCNQFRGDGYFLVFDTKNVQDKLFNFANSFCEEINKSKEEGKLKDFYIRTYINIGAVSIEDEDSEIRGVGGDVDEFLRLVDNKEKDRIQVKEINSAILVCTSECYKYLNDGAKRKLNKYAVGEIEYYICEFRPQNLVIRLMGSNKKYNEDVWSAIQEELTKQAAKIINIDSEVGSFVMISNKFERKKIYVGLKKALEMVAKKAAQNGWKELSVVLVDIERRDAQVTSEALFSVLKNQKNMGFTNFLVWTDVCLDEFKNDDFFKNEYNVLTKHALFENMRVYLHDFSEKKHKKSDVIFFSRLNQRCVYLHSFDYGGIKLIKQLNRIDLEQYLRQQLEIGLVLSDGVIIHSAEAFRSEEVYNVLQDYKELIKDGSIKLLFSSKVNEIRRDFGNYIDEKIREYSISKYGEIEVASLKTAKAIEGRLERTIELLSLSPRMIKRDGDGTSNLEELIKRDFRSRSMNLILEKGDYGTEDLTKHNYSLFQLLNAKYVENDRAIRILPEDIKQNIIEKIEELVNGVISASIVNRVFEEEIPKELKKNFKKWYFALLHRANFLYAQINTGKFLYAEYLPSLCKGSLFDFSKFFRVFQDCLEHETIGSGQIMKIRNAGEDWEKFKVYYHNAQLLSQITSLQGFEEGKLYDKLIKCAHEQLKKILD